jgi:ATP-binding protein involved in chromosome partitioning
MSELEASVRAALAGVIDPEIRRPITDLGMVDQVSASADGVVFVRVLLTISGCPLQGTIQADVERAVSAVPGVRAVNLELGTMDDAQRAALKKSLRGEEREIPFVRPDSHTQVILVASGKGGVGKSSVTVNLAMSLAALGKSVGVLDADIYGHSIPPMLGLADANPTSLDGMILPVPALGLTVISIGMLKESRDQVIAWRGPILDRLLQQFLADVYWGDPDFLIVDLPPGTGDVALSLGQKLPNAELIVVTTPQQAAAEVAERAGTMASMFDQKVLGVVENMAYLNTLCPHCGEPHRVDVFGTGGGEAVASTLSQRLGYEVPLLAEVPLEAAVARSGDDGVPLVSIDPANPAAVALAGVAGYLAGRRRSLVGLKLGVTPVGAANA